MGDALHVACLWHINRRTAAKGVAIGLFVMWLPLPFHVLMTATLAVILRANLPIALITVFINNPLTMGPMFYLDYWLADICWADIFIPSSSKPACTGWFMACLTFGNHC
ncbi:MAG: DUF2062 domain-containing protein [Candidatus Thiothrix singaporensis]|uniref:DUF2062 domain-containing protein n=1 Tax=Candidatus Thiothrix singaporensis TaxID=2799669 RepID=A0A7L6AQW5_9GAMM|nr:MAG: DUF2062 domain-containing protein [Candidatus Thiothrix singaporensis]